ncbi:MAG: hypothetical protein ACFCVE_01410 [Phycisphaerae bacterium]
MQTGLRLDRLIGLTAVVLFVGIAAGFASAQAQAQGHAQAQQQPQPRALPSPDAYVVVGPEGHIHVAGERVRYWGVIGGFPNYPAIPEAATPQQRQAAVQQAYADVEAMIDRWETLGFNFVRTFRTAADDGSPVEYEKGDGSAADVTDYFLHRLSERGFRVWTAGFNRSGVATAADVNVIDDPATAQAWAAALEGHRTRVPGRGWVDGALPLRNSLAVAWDPRLEALALQRMTAIAGHYNQHAQLRWADDPVFAVWELSNEEWWIPKMLAGNWQKLPEYFQQSLVARWNDYLRNKYESDAALAAAWGGLMPDESLGGGSVQLLPMAKAVPVVLNDANPLSVIEGVAQTYERQDFSGRRASDVLEFLTQTWLGHKQRLAAALKPQGRSLSLSPMIYDTGRGEGIQMQYGLTHGDAVAHNAYINGNAFHKADELYPWDSGLDEYPRINEGVPWLEHNRPAGMPFFCYETQIQQPAKYRAEFPMRIASLAALQDWDIVCWHYWGPVRDIATADEPFEKPMDVTVSGHPQGYHFTFDAVQAAVMRAAGITFTRGHLKPAAEPTTFIFGRKSLFDPASFDYGKAYGGNMADFTTTTYMHGMRLLIDPTREDDEVIGPVVKYNNRSLPSPAKPTEQIAYHWRRSSMIWDAPNVVGYAGFLARWGSEVVFDNGLILENIKFHNDPEIAFPVGEDERYAVMILTSTDEEPLETARHMVLAMKSTSFNDGFELGRARETKTTPGKLPVREARVSATVRWPKLAGAAYTLFDFHHRPVGEGQIRADGVLQIPADKSVWTVEVKR